MPLPGGPGVAVSVDYFGPLPFTPRGNTYILLFTDHFSRRADMFPVTAAAFTVEGTANILVNQYIPLWGCPRTMLSDNGLQFCSNLSQAVYQMLGVYKLATSSYHPNCNEGVDRVNHTIAQMLAKVVNERQDDWDLRLPHVEFACNNSVSVATGLVPNEVCMGKLPRLPLTVFDRTGVVGHQSLARDHLAYFYLATDRRKRANDIVRAQHALTVSRVNRRNSALADALRPAPNFAKGGWAWVYNSASTIRQGVKANIDARVVKAKLALNWTGPYKIWQSVPAPPFAARGQAPLFGTAFLPARFGRSSACGHRALRTMRQPPRQREHAQIPTGGTDDVRAQQIVQEVPAVPRHSRRRFDPPPTAVGGADHRSSVGTGARWSHRGGIQHALGRTLQPFLGAANGPPSLPLLHLALLVQNPGPAPPNQTPLPPNADRGGTARALPQQRGTFPNAGLRLCSPRRLAPSLPRHGSF